MTQREHEKETPCWSCGTKPSEKAGPDPCCREAESETLTDCCCGRCMVCTGEAVSLGEHAALKTQRDALLEAAHFAAAYFLKRQAQGLEGGDAKNRLEALQKAVALCKGREGAKQ